MFPSTPESTCSPTQKITKTTTGAIEAPPPKGENRAAYNTTPNKTKPEIRKTIIIALARYVLAVLQNSACCPQPFEALSSCGFFHKKPSSKKEITKAATALLVNSQSGNGKSERTPMPCANKQWSKKLNGVILPKPPVSNVRLLIGYGAFLGNYTFGNDIV